MSCGLTLSIASDPAGIRAARRLRHAVFVEEMGARPDADGSDGDRFDAGCTHLILREGGGGNAVVGTLRIGPGTAYTAREFDLGRLLARTRRIAEVGRVCLHPDHRGGAAGPMLLSGVLDHLRARGVELAVGTASLAGHDPAAHLPALRRLRIEALAPEAMRPVARGPGAVPVEGFAPRAAMRSVPALIKAYLRAGAMVGDGAYVDAAFNTVDICMVMDMARVRLPMRAAAPPLRVAADG